jgi:hypothetical protein
MRDRGAQKSAVKITKPSIGLKLSVWPGRTFGEQPLQDSGVSLCWLDLRVNETHGLNLLNDAMYVATKCTGFGTKV